MKGKTNYALIGLLLLLLGLMVRVYMRQEQIIEKLKPAPTEENRRIQKQEEASPKNTAEPGPPAHGIDILTSEDKVVPYVKSNGRLPDYYITKQEARQQGWDAGNGNLCDVLPGKAIGGDIFTNREGNLPRSSDRKWYEADLNYNCGRRNAHRLLYSSDGLVFVTHDHYKTFEQK